ncbi:MAG TPA: glycerate dehydrogenase [Planctomycetaceae bacterium]|nr:glycerate dehydrogenase [Planctomycetaceae bacterium]
MALPVVVIPADFPPLVSRSPLLPQLDRLADVRLYLDRPQSAAAQIERIAEADIVLNSRGSLSFPQAILQALPRLKMLAVCGIGYDSIHLPTATQQGIVVCNIPGRTAPIVAEHALALLLATARRMAWMTAELRSGRWPGDLSLSLAGRQLGVIGTGHIGCEMLRLAHAIGMQTVAWSLHPDQAKAERLNFRYVSLPELLQTSDAVSLHTRLSDQTRHLLNAERLALMKPTAVLINTARGAIVDSVALAEALQKRQLFAAGLDVYEQEPLPADHPLLACEQVVLTPHSADMTQAGVDLLTQGCIDNIEAFLQGRPQNVVNPDVLSFPQSPSDTV